MVVERMRNRYTIKLLVQKSALRVDDKYIHFMPLL
jgi:hypothetical protein